MKGHIVVEGGVHGTGPNAQGDGEKAKPKEMMGAGKAKQCNGGKPCGNGSDFCRSQFCNHPGAQQAGNDRPAGNN